MARPLAPSPLSRPAASGRPTVQPRNGARLNAAQAGERRRRPEPARSHDAAPRVRSHAERRVPRPATSRAAIKRRRANVLFVLALIAACSLFLAVTTTSPAMIWVAVAAFVALLGYVCLLGQLRQRERDMAPAPAPAPMSRPAPRRSGAEGRRHASGSAPARRHQSARPSADRWSHAV